MNKYDDFFKHKKVITPAEILLLISVGLLIGSFIYILFFTKTLPFQKELIFLLSYK